MAEKDRIAPSDNSFAVARDANQENASIKLFHESFSCGPADTKVAQQSSPSIQQMLNGFSIGGADADPTAEAKKLDRD